MEKRKEELDHIFEHLEDKQKALIEPMIDKFLFIENKLNELEQLPFIRVHPKEPIKQRATPASKLYKETMQIYMALLKILVALLGVDAEDGVDPVAQLMAEFKAR